MRSWRGRASVLVAAALLAGCGPAVPSVPVTIPAPTPGTTPTATRPATSTAPVTPTPTPTPTPTLDPLAVTVMSYNTLTGRNDCAGCRALKNAGRGDELALDVRMPAVAAKVDLADPDIIGFQENEGSDPLPQEHLAELLAGYTWAEPESTVPIAVRADRFAIAESGVSVLEKGRQTCRSGDRTNGRYVTWARLTERGTERQLWVFNTHLHPYDTTRCAALRAKNIDKLVAVIEKRNPDGKLPQLVTGDFNAFGDETRRRFRHHVAAMAELGMVDSHEIAGKDSSDVKGAASAGWMTAEVAGRSRLGVIRRGGRYVDYVWVPRGASVSSWQVLSGPGVESRRIGGKKVPVWTGVMASDHSPVVAAVVLADPAS